MYAVYPDIIPHLETSISEICQGFTRASPSSPLFGFSFVIMFDQICGIVVLAYCLPENITAGNIFSRAEKILQTFYIFSQKPAATLRTGNG